MPWHIGSHQSCSASRPYAVIKDADGKLEACHTTREKAKGHMAALYANEGKGMTTYTLDKIQDAERELVSSTYEFGKAVLSGAAREALPDSAYACPEKRKYPHHRADGSLDLPHLRNALARIADPSNDQCGKGHLEAHARAEEIGERGKALLPVKAQALDDDETEAWFAGRIPRRLLAIPFGGPIASPKAPRGIDLDGEWFSERTDIYGGEKALLESPERLLDWHHGRDQLMSRVVIGKTILDPNPDEDGWWVEAWLRKGVKHLEMVRRLVERGAQLYGSSEATRKTVDPDTGEITVWPMVMETLTTSPINTLSVLRPVKAADLNDSGIASADILSLLAAWTELGSELPVSYPPSQVASDPSVKDLDVSAARVERAIRNVSDPMESLRDFFRDRR